MSVTVTHFVTSYTLISHMSVTVTHFVTSYTLISHILGNIEGSAIVTQIVKAISTSNNAIYMMD